MKLLPNWRTVLRKAWSMKFMALATVLSGAEVTMTLISPDALPAGYLPALAGIVTALALFARLVAQKEVGNADK